MDVMIAILMGLMIVLFMVLVIVGAGLIILHDEYQLGACMCGLAIIMLLLSFQTYTTNASTYTLGFPNKVSVIR